MSFRLAGFRAVRITSYWRPGLTTPTDDELRILRNVGDAAMRNGVRVYVTVMSPGSATTPLTDESRADFAVVRGGDRPGGAVGRARDHRQRAQPQPLLAPAVRARRDERFARDLPRRSSTETYDAIKRVAGASLSTEEPSRRAARDRPGGTRPTHSPTKFIQEPGHRISGERANGPVMDAFAIHCTATTRASDADRRPPAQHLDRSGGLRQARRAARRRRSTAPRRPVRRCRSSTASSASSRRSPTAKAAPLHGRPSRRRHAGKRDDPGGVLRAGARAGLLPAERRRDAALPLARRARPRDGWQSGIHYDDGTPKTSKPRVTRSLNRTTGGSIARCPGVELPVRTSYLRFGTRSAAKRGVFRVSFRCDLDCRYWVRLENAATGATKLAARGSAQIGEVVQADLGRRRLKRGDVPLHDQPRAPGEPGPGDVRRGPGFRLP